MARRRTYSLSEQDQLQRLKTENRELKRTINKLRKQIDRIDPDRFAAFKEALDEVDEVHMQLKAEREARAIAQKNKWMCWECKEGTLRITVFDRVDGPHYFRRCDVCTKRTRLKKWTPDVEKE